MKILILSPHADDAAFSCGDHIIQWRKQGITVVVCTVFSRFKTSIISKDVKSYLNNSGFSDVLTFEKARSREDARSLKYFKTSFISPNLIDGAFRTYKKALIYQNFDELFSGKISESDEITVKKLNYFIRSKEKKFDLIIAPIGIGNHADHLITSLSARNCVNKEKIGFYIDTPYFLNYKNWNFDYLKHLFKYKLSIKWTSNEKLIGLNYYASQIALIVKNNRSFFFNEMQIYFPETILVPKNFR